MTRFLITLKSINSPKFFGSGSGDKGIFNKTIVKETHDQKSSQSHLRLRLQISNHTLRKICKMDETEFSLLHKPGEKWTYGASTKILGDLLSKVEGGDLEQSLKRLVLIP